MKGLLPWPSAPMPLTKVPFEPARWHLRSLILKVIGYDLGFYDPAPALSPRHFPPLLPKATRLCLSWSPVLTSRWAQGEAPALFLPSLLPWMFTQNRDDMLHIHHTAFSLPAGTVGRKGCPLIPAFPWMST